MVKTIERGINDAAPILAAQSGERAIAADACVEHHGVKSGVVLQMLLQSLATGGLIGHVKTHMLNGMAADGSHFGHRV